MSNVNKKKVLRELQEVVGEEFVTNRPEVMAAYSSDIFRIFTGARIPDFVVLPRTTEEVQNIVKIVNKYNIPIVPRGAGANIASQTVAFFGGIIIDTCRMTDIQIDEDLMAATVQPGVTHMQLRKAAEAKKLKWAYPMSSYSTTVIGNLMLTRETPFACRWGQNPIIALEVVLPNGEILRTGSAAFHGFDEVPFYRYTPPADLGSIYFLTRGAFGIIVKATVALFPMGDASKRIYIGFDDVDSFAKAMLEIQKKDIGIFMHAYSGGNVARCLVDYEKHGFLYDIEKISRVLEEYEKQLHKYFVAIIIEGSENRVAVEEAEALNIISKYDGVVIKDEKILKGLDLWTDQRYAMRQWIPDGYLVPMAAWMPLKKLSQFIRETEEIYKRHGLKFDFVAHVFDRGRTCYVESDIVINPVEPEIAKKLRPIFLEYRDVRHKTKAVSIAPRELLKVKEYHRIISEIKRIIDPKNIMHPGRLPEYRP